MAETTILVVDDEADVRAALAAVLKSHGWKVVEAANLNDMRAHLDAGDIDLVTLDLGLESEDGLPVARELRAQSNVPVVIITGQGQPFDRAEGLAAGADDYIVKPFDGREAAIRIQRVLDKYLDRRETPTEIHFDHSSVDLTRGLVQHADGKVNELTGLETQLLKLFLSRPAQVLSRDEINRALHGREWSPLDRTIDSHVARLRRKIGKDHGEPNMIRSVRGVGYVFTADVNPPEAET